MENAEEIMQLLEEFSKIKPKDIPRELEEYLGYVAKSGDPVFQWSLVKNLFREKLIGVITDFYESTLTVDLPPCPNVDPFNYERMKSSLLERFDSFSSAPFTVQRICELLTNPRKEYNRADKYMRAIEKNILVVSTREPGTGKRPFDCDSQSETVLNGMPDVKINESDGSLLHDPTELPYLGAPPASNDVTIETTTENKTLVDGCEVDINGDVKKLKSDACTSDRSWEAQEAPSISEEDRKPSSPKLETVNNDDDSLNIEDKCCEERSDINNRLSSANDLTSTEQFSAGGSSGMLEAQLSKNILPDSIDSTSKCTEVHPDTNEVDKRNDENEVSSTPDDASEINISSVQDIEEPTNSEAEATNSSLIQGIETATELLSENDIPSDELIETSGNNTVTITEITGNTSDEVDLECNEITGTIDSPASNEEDVSSHIDGPENTDLNLDLISEKNEDSDLLHPDSSNDICSQDESSLPTQKETLESDSEADSLTERSDEVTTLHINEIPSDQISSDIVSTVTDNDDPGETSSNSVKEDVVAEESSCLEKTLEGTVCSSDSPEDVISEGQSSYEMPEKRVKLTNVQSSSENAEDISDPERREGSIIQAVSDILPDSQQQITSIEEISVDASCDVDEEAMDIDDSSNQMMVSEGENEGEPMEQCDQLQS